MIKTIEADKKKEMTAVGDLIKSEGYRRDVYKDTVGKLTGGVGHLITEKDIKEFDPSWSDEQKDEYWSMKFKEDLERTEKIVQDLIKEKNLQVGKEQYEVLIEMAFNLGPNRFKGFKEMLKGLATGDYEKAADEMINSKWHKDFVKWNDGKDTSTIRSRRLEAKMRNTA